MSGLDGVLGWLREPLVQRLLGAAAGVALLVALARLARAWLGRTVASAPARYRARKLVTLVAYVLGAVFLAAVLGGQLSGLALTLGVVGAGVAFALQEVIASVAGWMAITFGGYLEPGDRVQLAGVKGDVIDVGLLRTTLMEVGEWVAGDLYTGRIVRVPNSAALKDAVFNYSADFPFLWDEIVVPITYDSDRRRAQALLEEAAESVTGDFARATAEAWQQVVRRYLIEDARLTPLVTVAATDNWLAFTVRYVTDYRRRRTTRDALTRRILDAADASGGAVRFASATFALVEAPPLTVRRAE